MTPILVRKVDEAIVRKLRLRAARHGRSMNDEVCHILRGAVWNENWPRTRLAAAMPRKRNRRRRVNQNLPGSRFKAAKIR
jgi:plasmid stability protein